MPDGMQNVDSTVLKLAKQYHDCNVRSSAINDERKMIRENAERLGIDPSAFQVGVRMAQAMTAGERSDFTGSLTRVLAALDGQESDLFGEEEIRKRDERKQKAADKLADKGRSSAELDKKTDTDEKSDPNKGGAGRKKTAPVEVVGTATAPEVPPEPPVEETGDELIARVAREKNAELEQREGGEILQDAGKGKPKSQSQISAGKLEAAKLN